MKKEIFVALGGFDTGLSSGEDYELCQRAKHAEIEVRQNPNLLVVHLDYPESIGRFLRREVWHGAGDFKSIATLLHSKVAILATTYTSLLVAAALTSLYSTSTSLALLLSALLIPCFCSFAKFSRLGIEVRFKNIAIWHIYLLARSLSFFARKKKARLYAKK